MPIMKITNPILTKALGLFGATMIRALATTLDYRILYHDPLVDPIHPRRPRSAIYILWHEYMLLPVGVRGKGLTVLISQHRDGELITQILRHLKFEAIRGSTTRGGVAALRKMLRPNNERMAKNDDGETPDSIRITHNSSLFPQPSPLILTPDGPRGPRRRLAEGSIFLASRLQMPIVCMGFGFDRPWRQKSWDRFAIPRPFSRARAVISPFMEIPSDLDRAGMESYRLQVEHILNHVTGEAEKWAESGRRKAGEMPLLRNKPAPQMAA
jgi:lysophospholipid acyltransferase (LPLAT)-like uncharacterized protein